MSPRSAASLGSNYAAEVRVQFQILKQTQRGVRTHLIAGGVCNSFIRVSAGTRVHSSLQLWLGSMGESQLRQDEPARGEHMGER